MTDSTANDEAVQSARNVMHEHLRALNERDNTALTATLHFPHYRLSGGKLKTWDEPDSYFADFLARAGDGWHHTVWDSLDVIAAEPGKVHLDVRFTRYREDDSVLGEYRSLWVLSRLDGVWAAQLRSSFAP